MPTAVDQLPRASFDGIEFPITAISLEGGLRDHVHEYPHSDGGSPELLGRKLYVCRMTALMVDGAPGYTGLFPEGARALRKKFDGATRGTLVIPTVGQMPVYALTWTEEWTPTGTARNSGVVVSLLFREDGDAAKIAQALIQVTHRTFDTRATATFDAFLAASIEHTLLDDLKDAVNKAIAIRDRADLYDRQLEAQVRFVADLCTEVDSTIRELQDPTNSNAMQALHDLWHACDTVANDITGRSPVFDTWHTPTLMTIGEVSMALYEGDNSHQIELLQLNPIEDAFAIPAATPIRYARAA